MSKESSGAQSGGIGFLGVLFIAFLVLKLTGYIDWSWWWITSPLWGPVALLLFGLIVYITYEWYRDYKRNKKK